MRTTLLLALALFPGLWATTITAEEAPPVPAGGINFYMQGPCTDVETGESGDCYWGTTDEGKSYVTLWQDDQLMLIREIIGDGYENTWRHPMYASY